MKTFLDENFLLTNETAVHLFHEYAKDLPIIDYHCHLSPKEIYENKQFNNITEAWLYGDHYKWRMMRANGVDESKVTGEASDYDRFVHGLQRFRWRLAIRCTTGLIWSFKRISVCTILLMNRMHLRFGKK